MLLRSKSTRAHVKGNSQTRDAGKEGGDTPAPHRKRSIIEEQRLNDEMFRTRMRENPEALALDFWEGHFCTQEALDSSQLYGRVLDLGSGTGEIDVFLARRGREVIGFDLSPLALEVARQHLSEEPEDVQKRVALVKGVAQYLPFPDNCFDSVFVCQVLEHISHPTPVINELARVLKPDGNLLVLVPRGDAYPDPTHVNTYEVPTLKKALSPFFEQVAVTELRDVQQLKALCRKKRLSDHPKVICQMRIKNEERWIREVLDSIARVADGIVVLDDGSTDRTPEICRAHPAVVDYVWQDKPVLDEVRDKNALLKMALRQRPDWILCMDGDEILEDSATERIIEAIRACPSDVSILDFEFLYMWDDLSHYRADGIYNELYHHRLFKLEGQDVESLSFNPTLHGGNFHCESVPPNIKGRSMKVDVKIKHLGYMRREDRTNKYNWYKANDPEHAAEGYYEHLLDQPGMVIAEWHERPFSEKSTGESATRESPAHPLSAQSAKQETKPEYYYANARQELVDLVPGEARRILDVGCGQGLTGGLLRTQRSAEVVGIEINPEVADAARKHLDRVVVGDLETLELSSLEGYFDCMILADILEHLVDPWKALKKLARCLRKDGTIVASLPNVRNLSVIRKILEGSWAYEEWGILDSTHLRFFALKDMIALFEQAGIEVRVAEIVRDPLFETLASKPPPGNTDLDFGGLVLRGVSPSDLSELTAQQFIFTGKLKAVDSAKIRKQMHSKAPTATVIIPVYNNLNYTRQCVTSLFTVNETTDFEVVVVDNGSGDGTAEYLKQLPPIVRTVSLPENLGFAKACNRGAEIARGRYLVFLNNDTIVQPGWLTAMVKCIEEDSTTGLVGNLQIYPSSQMVQQAGIVCGADRKVYSIYNNRLPADHPAVHKPREFQFVAGSCMLIEREFFRQIGMFDEAYLNSCEDIDLCMKVREAGRKVFYCPDSRIFHFESRTATGHSKEGPNYERFLNRWGDKMIRNDLDYYREDGLLDDMPRESLPKVAMLTTYNQYCGLATYAEFLVSALRKEGMKPIILAEKTADLRGVDEPDVIRCWTRDDEGGNELIPLIQKHGVQVLHVNHGGMFSLEGWLPRVLSRVRRLGVRVITSYHTTDSLADVFGLLARLSDRNLVHTRQNEIELVALGAPPDRIEWVPLGMPKVNRTDIFESKLDLNWDPAKKIVTTFGFVEPHKGILELIEAMKPLVEKMGVRLVVVGGPHPTNNRSRQYLEDCKRKAEELGLSSEIAFTEGFVSDEDVARYLHASDVIVMNYKSQRYESSAATAIALASGRPVVSSSAPMFEYPYALTFKTTEQFNLAEAIYFVLTNPFVSRSLMKNLMAYQKVARWDVVARRIIGIYEKVQQNPLQSTTDLMHYYRSHPDDIYADTLQRERVQWLRSEAEGEILEIGPANGYVVDYVGGTTAVDINRGRLEVAAALHPKIRFMYGDVLEGLPFKDKEFDQVMAPEILEHVDFDQAVEALRECVRVGKRVLATLPNADKPDYDPELVHNVEHRWLVNREAVDRLLAEAGCNNYELDVSEHLDFYYLDITADGKGRGARIHRRAALLPTTSFEPGEPIHVGIDAVALEDVATENRNIGRSMVNQFREIANIRPQWQFTLFGTQSSPTSKSVQELTGEANIGYAAWQEFPSSLPDVLYLPHPMGPLTPELVKFAAPTGTPLACTFYDLIPAVFSDIYLKSDPAFKEKYLHQLGVLKQHCDLFFCTSQCTAQDLQRFLQLPSSRLRIVHAGLSGDFRQSPRSDDVNRVLHRHQLEAKQFLLFAGTPDQRRNPIAMFFALAAVRKALNRDLRLAIAGEVEPLALDKLKKLETDCGLPSGTVRLLGFVDETELNALYHSALLLLFPSFYEGFGAPIVEAMAAGLPVIAGNNSSQVEVAGNAALLVNPRDVEEIAGAVVRLCRDSALRAEIGERGRRQSQRFTWRKVAEKTAIYLSEFLARRTQDRAARREAITNHVIS